MAGHSQFKNIMHRKGKQDAKRGKLFTKMIREITVAAKTGLPDPAANPRLRAAAGVGYTIPGDAVVLVFRNDFARRILAVDPRAGIEAPFVVHIRADGPRAAISWKRPSAVYAPYGRPEIDAAARELDAIFARIAAEAAAP